MSRFTDDMSYQEKADIQLAWLRFYCEQKPKMLTSWLRRNMFKFTAVLVMRNLTQEFSRRKPETFEEVREIARSMGFEYLREEDMTFWHYEEEEADVASERTETRIERKIRHIFRNNRAQDIQIQDLHDIMPTASEEELMMVISRSPSSYDEFDLVASSVGFKFTGSGDPARMSLLRFKSEEERQQYTAFPEESESSSLAKRFERSVSVAGRESGIYRWVLSTILERASSEEIAEVAHAAKDLGYPKTFEGLMEVAAKFGYHYRAPDDHLYRSDVEWLSLWINSMLSPRRMIRNGEGHFEGWSYEDRWKFANLPNNAWFKGAFDESDNDYILDKLRNSPIRNKRSKDRIEALNEIAEANGFIAAIERGIPVADLIAPYL